MFDHAAFLFLLYAQGILALAVLLMEPAGWRRLAVGGATLVGAAVCAWATYEVVGYPSRAFIDHHSIAYRNPLTDGGWVAAGYVAATCGALLLSTPRVVRWFGALNVAGLTVVMIVNGCAFSSVWCLYAAVLSIMIYWNFSRHHTDVDEPKSSFDPKIMSEPGSLRHAIFGLSSSRSRPRYSVVVRNVNVGYQQPSHQGACHVSER